MLYRGIVVLVCSCCIAAHAQTIQRVMNTKSNIEFYIANDGSLFYANDGNKEGMFWPRGSGQSYIFGGGMWFATKKQITGKRRKLTELGYNPNTGGSWFVPGELGISSDATDTTKYLPYLSTSFDPNSGLPIVQNSNTPTDPWPIRAKRSNLKTNFNLGDYVSDVSARSADNAVFLSEEDIVAAYTDAPPTNNPEFKPDQGYPFGINVHQTIYSWGFGRYRDVIFVRYDVTNTDVDTLINCWIGPGFDVDLGVASGGAANDYNSYVSDSVAFANAYASDLALLPDPYRSHPSNLDMVYQYRNAKYANELYGMIGFSIVESPVVDPATGNIINNDDSVTLCGYGPQSYYTKYRQGLQTFRQWNISNDPTTQDLRYDFISTGTKDLAALKAADQRVMLGTGPFTLPPGGHATATVAVGIARPSATDAKKNFGGLLQLIAFARDFFATSVSDALDSNKTIVQHFASGVAQSVQKTPILQNSIRCTPNPSSDHITLHVDLEEADAVGIEIDDVLGRCVGRPILNRILASGPHDIKIDLSMLEIGSYIVKLINNRATTSTAIVLRR